MTSRNLSQRKVKVLVTQSYPTLWDPMDCNPPGSSVHGILQARILEWVAFPFSRGSSQPRDQTWSPALQADSLPSEPPDKGVKLSIILKLSSHFKACERLVKSKRRICKILHFSLRKSTKDSSNRNRLMNNLNRVLHKWNLLGNIATLMFSPVYTTLNKEKFSDLRNSVCRIRAGKPGIARGCWERWSPSSQTFREELTSLYSDLLSPVLCG